MNSSHIKELAMSLRLLLLLVISTQGTNSWVLNNIRAGIIAKRISFSALDNEVDDLTRSDLASLKNKLIYPGTKWCGPGNAADGYDDLGPNDKADACCREHDNCPDIVEGGETRFNLTNRTFYTRLSCTCDLAFRQCLHQADTKPSNNIGVLYFDLLGTQCFKKEFPITGCSKRSGFLRNKCIEYSYDETSTKLYQWFDVPNYR